MSSHMFDDMTVGLHVGGPFFSCLFKLEAFVLPSYSSFSFHSRVLSAGRTSVGLIKSYSDQLASPASGAYSTAICMPSIVLRPAFFHAGTYLSVYHPPQVNRTARNCPPIYNCMDFNSLFGVCTQSTRNRDNADARYGMRA